MKKALPLLGALMLVSLLVCLSGCILQTTEITIVITDLVCTGFEENHDNAEYTEATITLDDVVFEEMDAILADNDMTKDDVEGVSVIGVYYQVVTGPTPPPAPATGWTVSGRMWVEVDGGEQTLIASYQDLELTGPMAEPARITTNDAGLAVLDAALADYLAEGDPGNYPNVVFRADRDTADISPTPTVESPLIMTWNGCLSIRADFTEEYDIYDMFPGE